MSSQMLMMLAVAAMIFTGTVLLLMQRVKREEKLAARILGVQSNLGVDTIEIPSAGRQMLLISMVGGLGELITRSGLLSQKAIEGMHLTLRLAGFRARNALPVLIGAKISLLVFMPVALWVLLQTTGWHPPLARFWPLGGAVLGMLMPDYIVRSVRQRHLRALERGLPDALDLLVICSEAGLGLEPGLERVGAEVRTVHRAVSDELMHTSQELRVNSDRRAALLNMGTRTGVENLRRLGGTLVQTLQYGTPLSQALRVLSAEMRTEALTAFETRAGRLPVLMTLPMILFILPCVFMVVGGPAMVKVMHTLRH